MEPSGAPGMAMVRAVRPVSWVGGVVRGAGARWRAGVCRHVAQGRADGRVVRGPVRVRPRTPHREMAALGASLDSRRAGDRSAGVAGSRPGGRRRRCPAPAWCAVDRNRRLAVLSRKPRRRGESSAATRGHRRTRVSALASATLVPATNTPPGSIVNQVVFEAWTTCRPCTSGCSRRRSSRRPSGGTPVPSSGRPSKRKRWTRGGGTNDCCRGPSSWSCCWDSASRPRSRRRR